MYKFVKIKNYFIDLDKIAFVSPVESNMNDFGNEYSFVIHAGTTLKVTDISEKKLSDVRNKLIKYMKKNAGIRKFTLDEDLFDEDEK